MIEAKEIPEELLESIQYDENSPSGLRWTKQKANVIKVGDIAGTKNSNGYWRIGFNGKLYQCHRVVYKLFKKINIQHTEIDHWDKDKDNNTIENLRIATSSEQECNKGIPITNTSGIKGVSLHKQKNKWIAYIGKNGKLHHLGYFDCKYEAGRVVSEARDEMHGKFASHK